MTTTPTKADPLTAIPCPSWCTLAPGHPAERAARPCHRGHRRSEVARGPPVNYPNRRRAYEAVFYGVSYWLMTRTPIVVISRKRLENRQENAFQLGRDAAAAGYVGERPKPARHLHTV